ncbi:hypothetical protein N0V85_004924 [Neurospora sp. IMI 360204]|nr:hypothetical protein N0V85_004924 [Neurospora sp. IMI 360204]
MVRFLDGQDERDHRGRRPSPTRSHHSGRDRDRDYSPDFISGPGRVPRPYASGAIPSTATAHQPPPPVPSPPLSPPIPSRTGPPQYVYDDDRDRDRDHRNGSAPLRGRDRSWERGSGTGTGPHSAARSNISASRSRSRSRGPYLASAPAPAPGTRERHIVRETKIYGGPELRDPERAAQALAVSDNARRARSPSRDSRVSRDLSRSRSRSRGARSIYTTDEYDSDYPRRRRSSPSRSRSRRSPSRSTRSHSRRSPSPLRNKAKDLFSPSTAALGVGVLGAIVGGLAAREATEHAAGHRHKSDKSHGGHSSRSRKEEERERKAALISTIVGAAVGGLGANVIEKKFEEKKRVEQEEKRARERGGYRELRDRDRDGNGDRGGRSRSRHGGGSSSIDTPAYSDDEGHYGNSGRYGTTTTVRGGGR